jgi:hypothetical protein
MKLTFEMELSEDETLLLEAKLTRIGQSVEERIRGEIYMLIDEERSNPNGTIFENAYRRRDRQ